MNPESLPGKFEVNPNVLKPKKYSKIKSSETIIKIIVQIKKIFSVFLIGAYSITNFIDKARIINLIIPKLLESECTKSIEKNKFIKRENQKKISI